MNTYTYEKEFVFNNSNPKNKYKMLSLKVYSKEETTIYIVNEYIKEGVKHNAIEGVYATIPSFLQAWGLVIEPNDENTKLIKELQGEKLDEK